MKENDIGIGIAAVENRFHNDTWREKALHDLVEIVVLAAKPDHDQALIEALAAKAGEEFVNTSFQTWLLAQIGTWP